MDWSKLTTLEIHAEYEQALEELGNATALLDEIKSELHKRARLEGAPQTGKDGEPKDDGSTDWEAWDENNGRIVRLKRTWTDRVFFEKKAGEILENAGHWDIYKEKALDSAKVKALRKAGEISDAIWTRIVQTDEKTGEMKLGYFTLKIQADEPEEMDDGAGQPF